MECLWCENEAEHLCDYMLGHVVNADGVIEDLKAPHFTCDAPMCGEHRRKIGHVCGTLEPPHADTIDHCPAHADEPPLEPAEWATNRSLAQRKRHGVRAVAWRSRFLLVRPP